MKRVPGNRVLLEFSYAIIFSLCFALVLAGCNNSSAPPPDTLPPTAPGNLTVTAISSTQINLSWTASTDNVGVTGYKVERCSGTACSNFVQFATSTTTTYSDTGLTPSTSYSYRVRATDAAGNLSTYSNSGSASTPAPPPISVSITPVRGGVDFTQSLNFTANLQNDVTGAGVTWTSSGGSFSSPGKTTATFIAPSATGNITITATSAADSSKSATATLAVTDLTGVTTYHNDLSRDGANSHEFALTTSNVKTATFGKLFSCTVDGAIYPQPLWVANLTIGAAKHNVVLVATQHESVYLFDADASPCSTLWHVSLIDAAHGGTAGETSVPSGPTGNLVGSGYGDVTPEVGITGTPVIDPATNIVYVVSKSVIPTTNPLSFFQRLHGLDLTTGSEKLNGNAPVTISASVAGNADGGATVAFNPQYEAQRPGLALVNGVVYVAWASHEDTTPYHGWVMGFDKTSLAQTAAYNDSPNGVQGGIWMSGGAPAADANNNLYVITGNGDYDGVTDYGDSILRLSSSLSLVDSFTPSVQQTLDTNDLDLGSGGAAILVDAPTAPPGFQHLLIGGGKGPSQNGVLYVANRDNLGQYTGTDTGIVQEFALGGMVYATSAFWQNNLYIASVGGPLVAYSFSPTTAPFGSPPAPSSQSATVYDFPGATPSVSSSGTTNGIVWAIDSSLYCTPQSGGCGPAVLHAYDATNLNMELWNSSQVAGDKAGLAVKFAVPTAANGKVYIGTRGNDCSTWCSGTNPTVPGELDVYGLKPN